jgi:hypothetical protein
MIVTDAGMHIWKAATEAVNAALIDMKLRGFPPRTALPSA